MIRVAALTSGKHVPSARFRVRQHVEPLRDLGIEVREYVPAISKYGPIPGWPKKVNPTFGLPLYAIWQGAKLAARIPGVLDSWRSSITWLERHLLAGCHTFEWFLKRPLVFDVDDAIWLTPPFGRSAAKTVAKQADVVLAGNRYLADWFSSFAHDVHVVPTAVDTERFKPGTTEKKCETGPFVIGWTGIAWNLSYLKAIEGALSRFMQQFSDAELLIIADKSPTFQALPAERIRYLPWSADMEVKALRQMDVGLMPLPDNEWTRGKCSFKMLQYMACGIPVIVSPVGMNAEVLALGQSGLAATKDAEWYEALEYLYKNRGPAYKYGQNGRSIVENYFSRKVISAQLAEIFRELN
jgi:glycosyltransferase involved in cell wall biosynthesis